MREIKFRVWDKRLKKMWEGGSVWFGVGSCVDANSTSDDVEIMQFTGLYDRNGKEIWEGDILRNQLHEDGEPNAWAVEWYVDDIHCGWNTDPSDTWYSEVIGNIYSNPDLLK